MVYGELLWRLVDVFQSDHHWKHVGIIDGKTGPQKQRLLTDHAQELLVQVQLHCVSYGDPP
jgi:hypothetical protein